MQVEVAAITYSGARPYNEDAHGYWHDGRYVCCLVNDGAGGHGGGDVASSLARETLLRGFSREPGMGGETLRALIDEANAAIVARQKESAELEKMRSTTTFLVIDMQDDMARWAHVGDSRIYLLRGATVQQVTTDQSLVQQMVSSGVLSAADAASYPHRNVLLSALGANDGSMEISVSDDAATLRDGDVFLMCTDGLWEHFDDEALTDSLAQARTPQAWLDSLAAVVANKKKPGQDNYTALTVWLSDPDQATRIMA